MPLGAARIKVSGLFMRKLVVVVSWQQIETKYPEAQQTTPEAQPLGGFFSASDGSKTRK
jgi:hypothetical protein